VECINEMKITAGNRRLAKVAVLCSVDTFVVNQTSVLCINICGENRHLRQAPKRYERFYTHYKNSLTNE